MFRGFLNQVDYRLDFSGSVETNIGFLKGASMNQVEVKISSERIDDIPLIVTWLEQMEIAKCIDQKLEKPHGNYQGMSYGQLSVLLLTYIITQSDHRLCAVEAVVYSQNLALSAINSQHKRINQAQQALDKLAKKPGTELNILSSKVENILKRYRVSDFFSTTITEETQTETRHIGRGRPSKNSPLQQVTSIHLQLHIQQVNGAIQEAETLAGWRLYVTNAPVEQLTLSQSVMYYRDEWLLERGFHRFKRGSLPALPIYFQNQNRITGLMFLLNIALRVFTLIEFVVQQALQQAQESLQGLYDGNPKRKTDRPSAEQILKAFCHITLYFLPDSTIFITPINDLQKLILSLMKMPESLYLPEPKLCKT